MNIAADAWADLKQLLAEFQPDVAALSFRNLDPLAGHQASYLSSLKTAALMIKKLVPNAGYLPAARPFPFLPNG